MIVYNDLHAAKRVVQSDHFAPDCAGSVGFTRSLTFLTSVDVVVTDYHFDSRSKHDGFSFAEEFKTLSELPLLLASDGDFNENEWKKHFLGILKKQVYAAAQLKEILQKS
jgi:hypothetical protein